MTQLARCIMRKPTPIDDDEMAAMTERLVKAEAELERLRAALEDTTYPLGEINVLQAELERLRADNKLLVERVLELELELNRGCR